MKEVMALIRLNMVNPTKEALAKEGFPSFSCRKCLGRGKKSIDLGLMQAVLAAGELPLSPVGEHLTESARLIPKRFFTLVVDDEQVDLAVKTIIGVNQTGNPGDGKIFVLPTAETWKIRTGECFVGKME
ncbi:MAG: P-II family nitrogen regulator [Acetanaerobacterium sp.]